jgi:hypothetical protein
MLSIKNSSMLKISAIELEIKDTTDTDRSTSCVDLHLEIDSVVRLRTKHYDKRDDFNFPIVNFPFICSNIFGTQIFHNGQPSHGGDVNSSK